MESPRSRDATGAFLTYELAVYILSNPNESRRRHIALIRRRLRFSAGLERAADCLATTGLVSVAQEYPVFRVLFHVIRA